MASIRGKIVQWVCPVERRKRTRTFATLAAARRFFERMQLERQQLKDDLLTVQQIVERQEHQLNDIPVRRVADEHLLSVGSDPADYRAVAHNVEVRKRLSRDGLTDRRNVLAAFLDYRSPEHPRRIAMVGELAQDGIIGRVESYLRAVAERGVQARRVDDVRRIIVDLGGYAKQRQYISLNRTTEARTFRGLFSKQERLKRQRRRIVHRAFVPPEAVRLFGGEHELWYRFVMWTGCRGEEAVRVRCGDFSFSDRVAELHVRAEVSKTGLQAWIVLAPGLAKCLRPVVRFRGPDDLLFPDISHRDETRLDWLRKDCKVAGIELEAKHGVINCRSHRLTFSSWLEVAGIEEGLRGRLRRDVGDAAEQLVRWTYSDFAVVRPRYAEAMKCTEQWFAGELAKSKKASRRKRKAG